MKTKARAQEEGRGALTAASKNHKIHKPILERRRRAKVTENIQQIRMLIPPATAEIPATSRFERAEILEKAVDHIKDCTSNGDNSTKEQHEFAAGYANCLAEVLACLDEDEDAEMRAKLCAHMANTLDRRIANLEPTERKRSPYFGNNVPAIALNPQDTWSHMHRTDSSDSTSKMRHDAQRHQNDFFISQGGEQCLSPSVTCFSNERIAKEYLSTNFENIAPGTCANGKKGFSEFGNQFVPSIDRSHEPHFYEQFSARYSDPASYSSEFGLGSNPSNISSPWTLNTSWY